VTIDEVFEGLGITEYYEARGQARGETIGEARGEARGQAIGEARGQARGEEEKAVEIARNLKKIGLPPEQIFEVTGLTEQQINGL
jgi:predicted transposase YdaD